MKSVVPPIPPEVVPRPRVEERLGELIARHRVVLVVATAGAGKTTAAAAAAGRLAQPVAWLSLDDTDVAPGRLVTYLDAAIGQALPGNAGVAVSAMSANVPHAEAAGLLSSSVEGQPLVIVVDQLERLRDNAEAWAVLESFVRHSGPGLRFVLLSRQFLPAGRLDPAGLDVGFLGESALAFTAEEAAGALNRRGVADVDPRRAVDETGGWVTGVLFEAWRSADHLPGLGGEADPLYGYLSAHILDQLDPRDRDFLIDTALLDEVTPGRATALGITDAGARLASLRGRALPVTWPGAHALRGHPRFREYLNELLERRPVDAVRDLRVRYGQLLAAEGRDEDATEVLLEAGAPELALAPASRAIASVIERLDLAQARRWLDVLEPIAADRDPFALSLGHLMLSVAEEEFGRGAAYADDLAARGLRDELARTSGRAVTLMTVCYAASLRVDALRAVVAAAPTGPNRSVAEYLATLYTHDPSPNAYELPPLARSADYPSLLIGKYFHGRIAEIELAAGSAWSEWESVGSRLLATRAMGHTEQALEIYERMTGLGARSLLVREAAPDLLLDAGRRAEARAALDDYDEEVHRTGSPFARLGALTLRAKMALRLDGDHAAALAALTAFDRMKPAPHIGPLDQRADTWRGLALLLAGEDARAAVVLRAAVATMRGADLFLELPAAAVFLAEAEWRLGDPEAADAAADVALEAAREQGSTFLLLEALSFVPAVASRRIDAETSTDSAWHDLGRSLNAHRRVERRLVALSSVVLREFGSVDLLVDGVRVPTGIRKSLELLAFLVAQGGRARRRQVLEALFGSTDRSAQAYLRQARSQLNRALPDEAAVGSEGDDITLSTALAVTSESAELERRLRTARHRTGHERLQAIVSALEVTAAGDYLPTIHSVWADERRDWVRALVVDAHAEAAQLALAAEHYPEARAHAEQVLREEPYREGAWQTLLQVAGMLGDRDGVIEVYRECERTFSELGTVPSETTRQLMEKLRR
jgi:DNA-binding SARP family transcriptional activator